MPEGKKEVPKTAAKKVPPPTAADEEKKKLKQKQEEEAALKARQSEYKRGNDHYEKNVKCTEYEGGYHDYLKDSNGQPLKNGQGCTATYEDGVIYEGSFLKGKWHSWDHND
jgi:hypothetical protein